MLAMKWMIKSALLTLLILSLFCEVHALSSSKEPVKQSVKESLKEHEENNLRDSDKKSSKSLKQKITLATTTWCPYTCNNKAGEFGIIGQYMKAIFLQNDIELDIISYPWSRAIKLAEAGDVDGLLTATPVEAPALIFSQTPISTYQMCFFTRKNNHWRYSKELNIGSNRLAVIQGYGYGEPLDSFTQKTPQITKLTGENGTARLMDILLRERVDIIVEDKLVLNWQSREDNLDTRDFREAGCMVEQPFFIALNDNQENIKLLEKLDKSLSAAANVNLLRTIKEFNQF